MSGLKLNTICATRKLSVLLLVLALSLPLGACGLKPLTMTDSLASTIDKFAPPTVIPPKRPDTVVVCRALQCGPARTHMTREFIFNKLLHLLDNNLRTKILMCQGDPLSHTCVDNAVSYQLIAGVTPGKMAFHSAEILDIKMKKGSGIINIALDYDMTFNGVKPLCRPARNILFARSADYIVLEDGGFPCKLTTVSESVASHVYIVDYIDLDYGVIGAHYSFGLSGPAYGGGRGYMLFRFQNSAHPLSPRDAVPAPPATKPDASRDPAGQPKHASPGEKKTYSVSPLPTAR